MRCFRLFLLLISFFYCTDLYAIQDTVSEKSIQFSAFVDTYFAYDFHRPANNLLPPFLFNHNRHNEFNLNLGFIRGSWRNDLARVNLALMAGTYAQYNLAHEQRMLQHVFEANAGIKLINGLWLDAGVLPSFYGLESAISIENPTLTRSLIAENSPYYLAGASLTYEGLKNWTFLFSVLNGWQTIRRLPGIDERAFGTQVQYRMNDFLTVNSSIFAGRTFMPQIRGNTLFHNIYTRVALTEGLTAFATFDMGLRHEYDVAVNLEDTNFWNGFSFILRWFFADHFAVAGRFEGYNDTSAIRLNFSSLGIAEGANVRGFSLNLDYLPIENVRFSTEGKLYSADRNIFRGRSSLVNTDFIWTSSLAVLF